MAKQFGFEQLRGNSAAINGNKRPLAARTEIVDGAGGDFLAVPDSPRIRTVESYPETMRISEITSLMAREAPVGSRACTRSAERVVMRGSRSSSRGHSGITAISRAA